MHDMQVTYMVKPPQVNLTQSSTESLMGNGTYILLNTFDQLIHLWPKYIEKDTWTGKNGHNRKARVTWKMEK